MTGSIFSALKLLQQLERVQTFAKAGSHVMGAKRRQLDAKALAAAERARALLEEKEREEGGSDE